MSPRRNAATRPAWNDRALRLKASDRIRLTFDSRSTTMAVLVAADAPSHPVGHDHETSVVALSLASSAACTWLPRARLHWVMAAAEKPIPCAHAAGLLSLRPGSAGPDGGAQRCSWVAWRLCSVRRSARVQCVAAAAARALARRDSGARVLRTLRSARSTREHASHSCVAARCLREPVRCRCKGNASTMTDDMVVYACSTRERRTASSPGGCALETLHGKRPP